jgi:hypothetical protein
LHSDQLIILTHNCFADGSTGPHFIAKRGAWGSTIFGKNFSFSRNIAWLQHIWLSDYMLFHDTITPRASWVRQ